MRNIKRIDSTSTVITRLQNYNCLLEFKGSEILVFNLIFLNLKNLTETDLCLLSLYAKTLIC